jgi:integrase
MKTPSQESLRNDMSGMKRGRIARRAIVSSEANSVLPLKGEFERMAKRRFQSPRPFREGNWWWINVWQNEFTQGRITRKRKRMKVAPATVNEREVRKIAAEMLRPLNQGLESIGSAMTFRSYFEDTYKETALPLLASTTQNTYEYALEKYALPAFKEASLRELTPMTLQKYFNGLNLSHSSKLKLKDALGSVLASAVRYGLLVKNPLDSVRIAAPKVGKRAKPHINPVQFKSLVNAMPEPYATMVYVCVMAGLRVSELIGLKWEDLHADAITIDERFCRGDWGCPKTGASSATIGVHPDVIKRIHQLKDLQVKINWGARGATKTFKVVRSDASGDLVFQSLRKGSPMSDHNILTRHMKPAGKKLGIGWVNWQVLRRSYATWLVQAGADPKAVQGQMRHSRIGTTMDIYAQFVPDSQRRAVAQMMSMVGDEVAKAEQVRTTMLQ